MRIQLQGPSHAASLLAKLNHCRQMRQYCDVFLQVGNRTFAAHRAVLACAGTYFYNLFTRVPATSSAVFSLEFISSANFEKVLTFIYTGGILIDLIDVGVLYEMAERLGICELVRACHSTFPDLQASVSAKCKASSAGDLPLDSSMVTAASTVISAASVSASSVCSSAASCSSLSSVAGPSAAATPAIAPTPLSQTRIARPDCKIPSASLSLGLKEEDIQSHVNYGRLAEDHQLQGGHLQISSSFSSETEFVPAPGLVFQLKIEEGQEVVEAGGGCEDGDINGQMLAEVKSSSQPQSSDPVLSDSCSLPDSLAQAGAETCTSTSSSGDILGSLQVTSVEDSMVDVHKDRRLMLGEVETGEIVEERKALQGNETMEGTQEEQWGQLASEIIELSDDENYMEEEDMEEDDDNEFECVEHGNTREGGNTRSQETQNILSCETCSAPLPADPGAILRHGETHLTELGVCRVCGASFSDHTTSVSHSLSHVGVQLFTCDMCHLQFCSQNKLLRHQHQTASCYSVPQDFLSNSSQTLGAELKCAACTKTLNKDFQALRDHLLSHVFPQNLTCGVCHLPQLSLCSLLWHTLTHLSLPVYSCPHCAQCFVESPLLDRHMTVHAEEEAVKEGEHLALKAHRIGSHGVGQGEMLGVEEMHCFLCPEKFHSSSAFQYHLSLHTTETMGSGGIIGGQGWFGKRKADQSLECPLSAISSSPQDIDSLVKISNLGLGMALSIREKFIQKPIHNSFSRDLTNENSGQEDGAGAAGVRGKWYRCRFCGKRFAHSGEFTYHLRIHTGEKPYQCKVCLRFFRGRSTMICHLKTHAGALMYRCTVCGLYFSTLKLVSSHMELHKDHLPPDFNIEQTFMYNDHSKEPLLTVDT